MTEGETKLIRMALEIHQFFRRQNDAADAAARHLQQFWAPTMRREFLDLIVREGDAVPATAREIAAALAREAKPDPQ